VLVLIGSLPELIRPLLSINFPAQPCSLCSWLFSQLFLAKGSDSVMPKERKGVTAVPSRQWSCSEMVDGHKALMKAKEERESDDEIQNRIQDSLSIK